MSTSQDQRDAVREANTIRKQKSRKAIADSGKIEKTVSVIDTRNAISELHIAVHEINKKYQKCK